MPTCTHNPKEGGVPYLLNSVLTAPYLDAGYSWCPPQRMLRQAWMWRSWCHRKTSGSTKLGSSSCRFCFKVSFPLLQVFMLFLTLLFKLMPSLFQKSLGNSDLWLSSTFIWAVLDKCAHSPFVKPGYTPHLHCCSYLGRWCYPGCLP